YTTKTGGARVSKIARDLALVKRQLNVEHKHIDFKFGAQQTITAQTPTNSTPIIIPLPLPVRGTGYDDRIGNQIRIVHMTSKLKFLFKNNQDLIQRVNVRAQIIFAKDAVNVPVIANLYDTDANGHYTPMSMVQTQEYKKYLWLKTHDHKKGYTQPNLRYSGQLVGANNQIYLPNSSGAGTMTSDNVTTPTSSLQDAPFYSNRMGKCSVRVFFENGSDTNVEQMKPYLVLRSDAIESGGDVYDPCQVSGIIRMTYVDN
uniref:hypothetical protein n=1 Tax=Limnohabitans sp. TaxID=1907725 RepID=UPI0040471A5E